MALISIGDRSQFDPFHFKLLQVQDKCSSIDEWNRFTALLKVPKDKEHIFKMVNEGAYLKWPPRLNDDVIKIKAR